jgi:hypothetical protein
LNGAFAHGTFTRLISAQSACVHTTLATAVVIWQAYLAYVLEEYEASLEDKDGWIDAEQIRKITQAAEASVGTDFAQVGTCSDGPDHCRVLDDAVAAVH